MRMRIVFRRRAKALLVLFVGMFVLAAPASAAELTINWTDIGNVISGVADIMPSIGNVVTSVVPILILLSVLGFVLGLFDGILSAIKNAFGMFR